MDTGKYIIREYTDRDREGICNLYCRFFNKTSQDFDKLCQWQFTLNPAAKDMSPEKIVLEYDGRAIGFISAFPVGLKLADKILTVFSSAIFMVNPDFRGHGVTIARRYLNSSGLRITLSAGEVAAKLYRALGAMTISENTFVALKFYSTKNSLKEVVKARKFHKLLSHEAILNCIAKPLDLFFKIINSMFTHVSGGPRIEEVKHFDDNFEVFWEDVSGEYKNIFIRNKQYLNWRFFQAPFEKPKIFAAFHASGRIKGYIAVGAVIKKGIQCGKVIDYLVHKNDEKTITALINYAIKYLRREGVELVYSELYTGEFKKAFLKNGFLLFKRKKPNPIWLKDNSGLSDPEEIRNRNNWFYTGSEGDGFIE